MPVPGASRPGLLRSAYDHGRACAGYTRLRRNFLRFSSSAGVTTRWRLPSAENTLRPSSTMVRICSGFAEMAWSQPSISWSRVKCFSMTQAPSAIAASGMEVPRLWSLKPTGTSNASRSVSIFRR